MATPRPPDDTDVLLSRAAGGDAVAVRKLMGRHRDRLRRMVSLRLGARLAAQVDASDVVREALADAESKLGDFLRERPMPFYPWLHRLAAERLTTSRRGDMPTEADGPPPDETFVAIPGSRLLQVDLRAEVETTPGQAHVHKESRHRTRIALVGLSPPDRELLVMHYLEELDFADIAAILGVDEATAKMQHLRALQRIRVLINERESGGR